MKAISVFPGKPGSVHLADAPKPEASPSFSEGQYVRVRSLGEVAAALGRLEFS